MLLDDSAFYKKSNVLMVVYLITVLVTLTTYHYFSQKVLLDNSLSLTGYTSPEKKNLIAHIFVPKPHYGFLKIGEKLDIEFNSKNNQCSDYKFIISSIHGITLNKSKITGIIQKSSSKNCLDSEAITSFRVKIPLNSKFNLIKIIMGR